MASTFSAIAERSAGINIMARGFAFIAAACCVAATVVAARWGWADVIAQPVLKVQANWQRTYTVTGQTPSVREWQSQYDSINLAQALESQNPAWMEAKAVLLSMPINFENAFVNTDIAEIATETTTTITTAAQRSATSTLTLNKTVLNQNSALTEQLQAITARPVSAYSWAKLAWIKYQAGQVDDAFYLALHNAAQLGPWEPEVQFVVIDLGFALWDEMPKSIQPVINSMAANATHRYAATVAEIASKRGRLNLVCSSEKLAKMKVCTTGFVKGITV